MISQLCPISCHAWLKGLFLPILHIFVKTKSHQPTRRFRGEFFNSWKAFCSFTFYTLIFSVPVKLPVSNDGLDEGTSNTVKMGTTSLRICSCCRSGQFRSRSALCKTLLNHERHFKELSPSHRGICLIIFAGTTSFGMLMNPQLREVLCTKLLYMRFNAVKSAHKEI